MGLPIRDSDEILLVASQGRIFLCCLVVHLATLLLPFLHRRAIAYFL